MNEENPLDLVDGDRRDIRRPMNAFLIFCKRHRSIVRERNPDLDNRNVTRILGDLWANLKDDEKTVYTDLAKQYKDAFMKANPDYKWHNPDKIHPITKPNTRPTNARIVKSDTVINVEGAIVPGKLADPSNMGGLSLLLMAGQQSSATCYNRQVSNAEGMESQLADRRNNSSQQPTQYCTAVESMNIPLLGGNTGKSDEAGNQDSSRTSLLQLAEMCSTEFAESLNEAWEEMSTSTHQSLRDLEIGPLSNMQAENLSRTADIQPALLQTSTLTPDHHLRQALFGHQPRRSHEQVDKISTVKVINNNDEKKDRNKDLSAYDFDEQDEEDNGVLTCGKRVMEKFIDRLYGAKKKIRLEKYSLPSKSNSRIGNPLDIKSSQSSKQSISIKKVKTSLDLTKKSSLPMQHSVINKDKPVLIKKETPQSYVEKVINETYCISDKGSINGNQVIKHESGGVCRRPVLLSDSDQNRANMPQNLVKSEISHNKDFSQRMTNEETNVNLKLDMIKPQQAMTKIKSKSPQVDVNSISVKPAPTFTGLKARSSSYSHQGAVDSGFEDGSQYEGVDDMARSQRFHSNSFSEDISQQACSNTDDMDDNQPVRKSKRRNRGQRYQELIHEGIIQPSKERLAAWRNEWETSKEAKLLPDEKEFDFFLESGLKSVRKRTVSESDKCSRSPEDSKRYKTSDFDLEAQIATLPACSVEPVGRGHRKTSFSKIRHESDVTSGKQIEQSTQEVEKSEQITPMPNVKLKQPDSTGSQKRKARKTSITHLIICKNDADSDKSDRKLMNAGELAMVCSTSKPDTNDTDDNQPTHVSESITEIKQDKESEDVKSPHNLQLNPTVRSLLPTDEVSNSSCPSDCSTQRDSENTPVCLKASAHSEQGIESDSQVAVTSVSSDLHPSKQSSHDELGGTANIADNRKPVESASYEGLDANDKNCVLVKSVDESSFHTQMFPSSVMHEDHGIIERLRESNQEKSLMNKLQYKCDSVESIRSTEKIESSCFSDNLQQNYQQEPRQVVEKLNSKMALYVSLESTEKNINPKLPSSPSISYELSTPISVEQNEYSITELSDNQNCQHNSSLQRASSLVVTYDSGIFSETPSKETVVTSSVSEGLCSSYISSSSSPSSQMSTISDCVTTVIGASQRPATFVYS